MILRIIICIIPCFLQCSAYAQLSAGYTDSAGKYTWIEHHNSSIYTDTSGTVWYKITENKTIWSEAIAIRDANLYALISLGYDSAISAENLFLYDSDSPLFTKFCHLRNDTSFTRNWKLALNSSGIKRNAKKSPHIMIQSKKSHLVLKFYPNKSTV